MEWNFVGDSPWWKRKGGGGVEGKQIVGPFSHLTHSQFLPIRFRKKHFEYLLNFFIIVPFNIQRLFFTYYTDYFILF